MTTAAVRFWVRMGQGGDCAIAKGVRFGLRFGVRCGSRMRVRVGSCEGSGKAVGRF